MNRTDTAEQQATSAQAGMACCNPGVNQSLRGWRHRRALAIAATTAAVGTGLVFNWGWLVAAGIAPVILSVLPCLVMCALGLCASKLLSGGVKAKAQAQADNGVPAAPQVTK